MDRASLTRIVRKSGCRAIGRKRSGLTLVDCPDVDAKIALLDAAAWSDARYDQRIRRVAVEVARGCGDTSAATLAPALHAFVRDSIRYLGEGIETFQSSWDTFESGVGDCDDTARLLLALARSIGQRARLEILRRPDGTPRHATVSLWDGQAWRWAECTLAARFGEHPIEALKRLRTPGRSDDIGGLMTVPGDVTHAAAGGVKTIYHQHGREILSTAWDALASSAAALPEKTEGALQAVQAIALVEGGTPAFFPQCPQIKNNFGSVQVPLNAGGCGLVNGKPSRKCPPADGPQGPFTIVCPPDSGACVDRHPGGDFYQVCFASFDTPEAGAVHFLRELLVKRPSVAAVIGSGSADAIGEAIHATRYAETDGATYANGIALRAKELAAALNEPVMVAHVDAPLVAPWMLYGGGAVSIAVGLWAAWKYGRKPVEAWKGKAA